jgi:hypothetical protein
LRRNVIWLNYFLSTCICVYCHHHALIDSPAQLVSISSLLVAGQVVWRWPCFSRKKLGQNTAVHNCNLIWCFKWNSVVQAVSHCVCLVCCGYYFGFS